MSYPIIVAGTTGDVTKDGTTIPADWPPVQGTANNIGYGAEVVRLSDGATVATDVTTTSGFSGKAPWAWTLPTGATGMTVTVPTNTTPGDYQLRVNEPTPGYPASAHFTVSAAIVVTPPPQNLTAVLEY